MEYLMVLDAHYERIACDLDVYEIESYIRKLQKDKPSLSDEFDKILERNDSTEDQAKRLLNIFKNSLQSKIPGFVEALTTNYSHLAEDFKTDLKKIWDIVDLPAVKNPILRRKYLEEIMDHFKRNTSFMFLHGLPGSGKTTLAVQAAMHYAISKSVYWVKAGGTEGSQLKVLQILLSRLQSMQEAQDSQSDPEQLLRKLRGLLDENVLVILDDVSKKVDLDDFKTLHAKFLIITTDMTIKNSFDSSRSIDMSEGFTDQESLQLISKVVKEPLDSLGKESIGLLTKVHKYYQGYPLGVSLIANQLATVRKENWPEYLNFLNGGDTSVYQMTVETRLDEIMEKCLESLCETTQSHYKKLAIFKDGVFIPTQTLEVLWNCGGVEADTILNELENKSMVIMNRKVAFGPVYEVHSTVSKFLRRQQTVQELKKMHRKFVDSYIERYRKIVNIPDDHYIHYYMIHHIKSAGCLSKFRGELFSLEYIMTKLVACGPNDIAEDLKLYKDDIENAGYDKRRLKETLAFSERFGWDIFHTKVKDLQFFLQMPENEILFKEAMDSCKKNNHLVLESEWLNEPPKITTKKYPFQSRVTKVYYLSPDAILLEELKDGKKIIVKVKLSGMKKSVIADGSILCISRNSSDLLYKKGYDVYLKQLRGKTPDTTRQFNGHSRFSQPLSFGTEIRELPNRIRRAAFSRDGEKIIFASESSDGVYYINGNTVSLINKDSDSAAAFAESVSCCFCYVHDSEVLVYARAGTIYLYEPINLKLITSDPIPLSSPNIIDVISIPGKKCNLYSKGHQQLLVFTRSSVEIVSWEHGLLTQHPQGTLTLGKPTHKKIYECKNSERILKRCSATDRWIVIATSDGCLVTRNSSTEENFFNVGYGEVEASDIIDNSLIVIKSRGPPLRENGAMNITIYDLNVERLTNACQLWHAEMGYLLATVEPGKVMFYEKKNKRPKFEREIHDPKTVAMSQMGDTAVIGDSLGNVHRLKLFGGKLLDPVIKLERAVDFLKISPTGKCIVAGCATNTQIINKNKVFPEQQAVFDCFFEEGDISSSAVIVLFKNGEYGLYSDVTHVSFWHPATRESNVHECLVTCASYQNKMLIYGTKEGNLHKINVDQKTNLSKAFRGSITSCCIEPPESFSAADPTKPWIAVAFAENDKPFRIVLCTKDLVETRVISLDYAREEIQQLVFSKTQMILMARCDWLCFWQINESCDEASGSTLHPVWRKRLNILDKDKLIARFKLQHEVLSVLPSENFEAFNVVDKERGRRLLSVVDYTSTSSKKNGSLPSLNLDL